MGTQASFRLRPGLAEWVDVRHLLLGAILPDVTRFSVVLVDILDWPAIPTFTYFVPFHSLLIVSLLAGAVALLAPLGKQSGKSVLRGSGRAFGLIMVGAVFHFLLDELDGWIGCGSTTFYPFYFRKPVGVWDSEGLFFMVLMVVSAMAIGMALSHQKGWPALRVVLSWRRVGGAMILVVIACLIPLFFREWMIERNAYYLGFMINPGAFEGETVEFCFSKVVGVSPPVIQEFDRSFELSRSTPLRVGDWISVRGVYQEGVVEPVRLVYHHNFSDIYLSLVGAGAFGWMVVFNMKVKRDT